MWNSSICRHYLYNACKFGVLCKKLHIENWRMCPKKGCIINPDPNCKYRHERRKCKFFQHDRCYYSQSCWFIHEPRKNESVPSFNSMFIEKNIKSTAKSRSARRNKRKKSYRLKAKLKDQKRENDTLRNELEKLEKTIKDLKKNVKGFRDQGVKQEVTERVSIPISNPKEDKDVKIEKSLPEAPEHHEQNPDTLEKLSIMTRKAEDINHECNDVGHINEETSARESRSESLKINVKEMKHLQKQCPATFMDPDFGKNLKNFYS